MVCILMMISSRKREEMMSQSSAHHDARARAFIDEKSFEPYYYSNGSRSTCVCEASVSFLLHDIVSIVLTNHQPSSTMGRIRAALVLLATMSPAYVEAFQGWTNGGRPRPFALFATPASRKGRATPSATSPAGTPSTCAASTAGSGRRRPVRRACASCAGRETETCWRRRRRRPRRA